MNPTRYRDLSFRLQETEADPILLSWQRRSLPSDATLGPEAPDVRVQY